MKKKRILSSLLTLWLASCGLTYEQTTKREEYLSRAETYYRSRKYLNAWQQIERALEIDPQCKRALIAKGWALFYLEKYEESEGSFLKAYQIDNADPWLHHGLGAIAFKRGSLAESKMAQIQRQIASSSNQPQTLKKFEADLKRFEEERQLFYEKSLDHFNRTLRVDSENRELYKIIAMVYLAQGLDKYPLVISNLDIYIRFLDEDLSLWEKELAMAEQNKQKTGIQESEREAMEATIEKLNIDIDENRKEYRIVQALAAEACYQLAAQVKQKTSQTTDVTKEQAHLTSMYNYCQQARSRIDSVLKTAPYLKNHYLNLANIAKLEGNNQEVLRYLREYVNSAILDPKTAVKVKQEIENLERQKK